MSRDREKPKRVKLLIAGVTLLALASVTYLAIARQGLLRAESKSCRSRLISIGLGARMWASEHGEAFPSGLLVMSNELNSPKILFCAGSKPFPAGWNSWSAFDDRQSSYALVSTNIVEGETNRVFLRCKFHGHLLYGDGSVFDGKKRSGNKSED